MRPLILTLAVTSPLFWAALWSVGHPWAGFFLMAILQWLVLYPTLAARSQWLGPVMTVFRTDAPEVWLTIDDGPTDDTLRLLEMLDEREVKATFFVKGQLVERNQNLAHQIIERGHSLGNHSYAHPSGSFWCLPPGRIAAEIDRCAAVLERFHPTRLFRAPVGMKNPFVHPALKRRSLLLVGWTARSFDGVKNDVEGSATRIANAVRPGTIILMHQGREWSVRTIERTIDEVKRRGYRFVVPSEERLATKR